MNVVVMFGKHFWDPMISIKGVTWLSTSTTSLSVKCAGIYKVQGSSASKEQEAMTFDPLLAKDLWYADQAFLVFYVIVLAL